MSLVNFRIQISESFRWTSVGVSWTSEEVGWAYVAVRWTSLADSLNSVADSSTVASRWTSVVVRWASVAVGLTNGSTIDQSIPLQSWSYLKAILQVTWPWPEPRTTTRSQTPRWVGAAPSALTVDSKVIGNFYLFQLLLWSIHCLVCERTRILCLGSGSRLEPEPEKEAVVAPADKTVCSVKSQLNVTTLRV